GRRGDCRAIRRGFLTSRRPFAGMPGAQATARLKKNDGTTMACRGHWRTTPAQVKTEKTARHL
ncbi:hypothetical protein H5S77_26375, partial [Escherichia coli]|nr:hypothetical protein [Escherichia coli]